MLTKKQLFSKRIFDIVLSLFGLIVLCIPIAFLVIVSSFTSRNIGLFKQERVGQHARLFMIYKIRSMRFQEDHNFITIAGDSRVTRFGRFLRITKLDELPQLFNVLIGDMSIVGPRPDVAGYADQLKGKDRMILNIKPGITGPATLAFRNEEELLSNNSDPIKYNNEVIWPQKVKLNLEYIEDWSFKKDLIYIYQTIFS